MFPEYVDKYNQLQAAEQLILEQSTPRMEGIRAAATTPRNAMKQDASDRKENTNDAKHRRRQKKFPVWLLLLLVWVFGFLMALPLLQSWFFGPSRSCKTRGNTFGLLPTLWTPSKMFILFLFLFLVKKKTPSINVNLGFVHHANDCSLYRSAVLSTWVLPAISCLCWCFSVSLCWSSV